MGKEKHIQVGKLQPYFLHFYLDLKKHLYLHLYVRTNIIFIFIKACPKATTSVWTSLRSWQVGPIPSIPTAGAVALWRLGSVMFRFVVNTMLIAVLRRHAIFGRRLHLATGSMRYDTVYHTSISVCHTLRYTTRLLFCTSRCHTKFSLYWYYVFAMLSLLYQTVLHCPFL